MNNCLIKMVPFLLGSIIGCSKAHELSADIPVPAKTTNGSDTVNIGFNDTLRIPGHNLYLMLDTIYSDSRCPVGVECIWAGAFETGFILSYADAVQPFSLSTYPGRDADTTVQGITIRLLDLLPYPDIQKPVRRSEVRVKLGLVW
jgi:hypothetical protein